MADKTWENTFVNMIGTLEIGKDGAIAFWQPNQEYNKHSVHLKVIDDDPWSCISCQNSWVTVDGIDTDKVAAFRKLQETGRLNGTTRIVFRGHLVRKPGKAGKNDFLNLKFKDARPAKPGEAVSVDFDEALTEAEWNAIRKELKNKINAKIVPVAPTAPCVPF